MRFSVVLAGGSGIRLWPLSREKRPKQLIPLKGNKSLMEAAFERLDGVVPLERRWICGNARYEELVRKWIPSLSTYIGEPVGRDTLAAIGYSCARACSVDTDATMAFITSDHVIQPIEAFRCALENAFDLVEKNPDVLFTFGVKPDFPATSYGYLELGDSFDKQQTRKVLTFKEKPDLERAQDYLRAGPNRYLWNSGMFVWKATRFLELLERYEPDIATALYRITNESDLTRRSTLLELVYPTITKKSVDYGIMEPASKDPNVRIVCSALDLEWKDIGSWTTYGSLAEPDEGGNLFIETASKNDETSGIFMNCKNNLIVSEDPGHLIACFGCEDMVIVHTADATLVCPKTKVEDLKRLHSEIKNRFNGNYV